MISSRLAYVSELTVQLRTNWSRLALARMSHVVFHHLAGHHMLVPMEKGHPTAEDVCESSGDWPLALAHRHIRCVPLAKQVTRPGQISRVEKEALTGGGRNCKVTSQK